MTVKVKIKRLNDCAVIPTYAHEYDAGLDLVACDDVIIEPGATVKVPTGIAISLPSGYEAQVRPRSGITLKTKLRVALGTIDAGYVGEIGVIVDNIAQKIPTLINMPDEEPEIGTEGTFLLTGIDGKYSDYEPEDSDEFGFYDKFTYLIRKGDRIAQLVIAPVEQAAFTEVDTLEETSRGEGGFGSSGVKA